MRYMSPVGRKRYSVDIGPNGQIKVVGGDILSGYSMAIHKIPWEITEYGRLKQSRMMPIVNHDLIFAGETIYHLPSWNKNRPRIAGRSMPPVRVEPPSDAIKRHEMRKLLIRELEFPQPYADSIVNTAFKWGGNSGRTVVLLADLAGTASPGVVLKAGLFGIFQTTVGNWIALNRAAESGLLVVSTIAISYGITAWAFDKAQPQLSEKIRDNRKRSVGDYRINEFESIWNASVVNAQKDAKLIARRQGISENTLKVLMRAMGDDTPAKLGKLLAESFRQPLSGDLQSRYDSLVRSGVYYNN